MTVAACAPLNNTRDGAPAVSPWTTTLPLPETEIVAAPVPSWTVSLPVTSTTSAPLPSRTVSLPAPVATVSVPLLLDRSITLLPASAAMERLLLSPGLVEKASAPTVPITEVAVVPPPMMLLVPLASAMIAW